DELNDIESSDTEINVLRTEEANNVITRLLQVVPEEAAVGTSKLESFWPSIVNACTSINDSDNTKNEFKSNEYSEIEKARLYTMLSYLHLVEHSRKRVEASTIVAEAARKGIYHACCIRAWATNYIQNGAILISKQGKYSKTWSFLWDEDILI
ncbi:34849_t:CDS:2, partial [Racocetra persica]